MTIISTIAMNPNNLKIHLLYRNNHIITGRDEVKGRAGDIFHIEGDPRLWVLTKVEEEGFTIDDYAETFYREEGFHHAKAGNPVLAISALKNFLRKTYGDYDYIRIHPHSFLALNITEEDLK